MMASALQAFFRFLAFACLVLLLTMGVFSKRGWLDWRRIVRQKAHLSQQIETMAIERKNLQANISEIKSSHSAQERLVRKTLGYVRANESVIELE